jgi:hypothetical protein
MTEVRWRPINPVARRLRTGAGPPKAWQAAALWVGVVVGAMVASLPGVGLAVPAVILLTIVSIPAIADISGWRIRLGIAWLAAEQGRRRAWIRLPRSVAAAEYWLAHNPDAAPRLRVSILTTAGRFPEARALLESTSGETPDIRASLARMRAGLAALDAGTLDPRPVVELIDALPSDQRRYHRLALAWTIAWVEMANGRPWRKEFAAASRGIGSDGIPMRWLIAMSIQQLLLPVCVAIVLGIWTVMIVGR